MNKMSLNITYEDIDQVFTKKRKGNSRRSKIQAKKEKSDDEELWLLVL